jgi:hypothetical protein
LVLVVLGNDFNGVKVRISLKRHKRFTDKALNHIAYIDSRIWESYSDARKQQILSDPRKEDNKVIITYNFATGEKEVI